MCLTDGIAIVERFTGDILKKISKPIQSSREYIYIRELPNIDKQSMALWVDKKTITLIDFSQDLMVPVFMFACNLIYENKDVYLMNWFKDGLDIKVK